VLLGLRAELPFASAGSAINRARPASASVPAAAPDQHQSRPGPPQLGHRAERRSLEVVPLPSQLGHTRER